MRGINLPFRLVSELVWRRVLENSAFHLDSRRNDFFSLMLSLESGRDKAAYNTGSISSSTAWLLFSAAMFFQPRIAVEIGTFIGRSAISIALGMDEVSPGEIHTCDSSNAIELPSVSKTKIFQHPKQTSTEMLSSLGNLNGKVDLFHFDGRVQEADLPLIRDKMHAGTVFLLDDFEGYEKGVANLAALRPLLGGHMPVYPCVSEVLRGFGLNEPSSTAMIVPMASIRLTAQ